MSFSPPQVSPAVKRLLNRSLDRLLYLSFGAGFLTGVVVLLLFESIGVLIALFLF